MKLGQIDRTPGKVFRLTASKMPDHGVVAISYNDKNGVRHLSRFRFKPGKHTDECIMYVRELATFSGTPREISEDAAYRRENKRVTKSNHKMLAKDIIEKFAIIQMYLILSGIMQVAADNATNPKEYDKYASLSDKYKKLSEAGSKEFYDFMSPFTRKFIDAKIQEVKDAISSRNPFGGEQLNMVERALSENCAGMFQHVGADYNNSPDGGDIPRHAVE